MRRRTEPVSNDHASDCRHQRMNTSTQQKAQFGHALLHSQTIKSSWDPECVEKEHERVSAILRKKYGVRVKK